jgi:hypothetical protein
MRKSGLHKEISSIFDGVPVPTNSALLEETEALDELMAPPKQDTPTQDALASDDLQEAGAVPQTSGPSLVQRMSGVPSECDSVPVVQVGRPMPTSKPEIVAKSSMVPSFSKQIKKAVFGAHSQLDARQKKTGVLVGILSIVFGVVLFVSLGGVGQTQATAANAADSDSATSTQVTKKTAQEWQRPEPLPQSLRNATSPVVMHSGTTQTGATTENDALTVKGIVFSKNKPSAIINNEILSEGQTFNGITITKITKETVEFETNEKRWTQTVQR